MGNETKLAYILFASFAVKVHKVIRVSLAILLIFFELLLLRKDLQKGEVRSKFFHGFGNNMSAFRTLFGIIFGSHFGKTVLAIGVTALKV
jgi:hypothetical protein